MKGHPISVAGVKEIERLELPLLMISLLRLVTFSSLRQIGAVSREEREREVSGT